MKPIAELVSKVTLGTPIVSRGVVIRELAFAPITADVIIRQGGLPFLSADVEGDPPTTDFAKAARYIAELTGIDEADVRRLGAWDFANCIAMLGALLAKPHRVTASQPTGSKP